MNRNLASLLVTTCCVVVGMSAGTALAIVPPDQLPPGTIAPAPLPLLCSCRTVIDMPPFAMGPWTVPLLLDISPDTVCLIRALEYENTLMATQNYESVNIVSRNVTYTSSNTATCHATFSATSKLAPLNGLQCSDYSATVGINAMQGVMDSGAFFDATIGQRTCTTI